jgi:hypothetical protein
VKIRMRDAALVDGVSANWTDVPVAIDYPSLLRGRAIQVAPQSVPWSSAKGKKNKISALARIRSVASMRPSPLARDQDYLTAKQIIETQLIEYVRTYTAAGCDFARWESRNSKLAAQMHDRVRELSSSRRSVKIRRDDPQRAAERDAAWLFATSVLLHHYRFWECLYCRRFSASLTRHKHVYCKGKNCGHNATARASMKAKRDLLRAQKIVAVKRALEKIGFTGNWKPRVIARANVTSRFLTRAINLGEIKTPKPPKAALSLTPAKATRPRTVLCNRTDENHQQTVS